MPRHRKAQVPRHRAQLRVDETARRVRLRAAYQRVALAFAAVWPERFRSATTAVTRLLADAVGQASRRLWPAARRIDMAAMTQPLAEAPRKLRLASQRLRPDDSGKPARPPTYAGPTTFRGAARGAARTLLVTPWFATGAGLVLAIGMFIYAPHTDLTFPQNSVRCKALHCSPNRTHPNSTLTNNGPSVKIAIPHHHKRRHHDAAAGLTFKFTVAWQENGEFRAVIAVSGRPLPSSWRLHFAMPGSEIGSVVGAQWSGAPSASSGVARPIDYGQSGSDGGVWGRNPDGQLDEGFSFWVFGTGSASTPTRCRFDGSRCSFT